MAETIRAAVIGVGNIGRACIDAIEANKKAYGDFELAGIVSRNPERAAKDLPGVEIYGFKEIEKFANAGVDVAFLCGGSKNDLFGEEEEVNKILKNKYSLDQIISGGGEGLLQLGQGPFFAQYFPVTVDTFDTHPRIKDFYPVMATIAQLKGNLAVISTGWHPGTGSDAIIAFDAYAVGDKPAAFYGQESKGGKSMGHSNALLTIPGVKRAIQYTHAIPEVLERARKGEKIDAHEKTVTRESIMVLENDTPEERARIEPIVKDMKDYFEGYVTSVAFIDNATFEKEHANAKQHDGVFIATGKIGPYTSRHELHCAYESNQHGTAGIMAASARGAFRLWQEGKTGACILSDIPVSYRSPRSKDYILENLM